MAAVAARQLGYTKVLVYRGGMPDWLARGLPVDVGRRPGLMRSH
jgi:rhodanese-related sulfurtransferase